MTRSPRTNRDHAKKQQRPMVEDEVIAAQLEKLVTPAITAQENYYRKLGMRDRILNLPLDLLRKYQVIARSKDKESS